MARCRSTAASAFGHAEIRQVAEVLLSASAEEVEVDAAIAFEPVGVVAFAGAAATPERQYSLHSFMQGFGDKRFVSSGILLVVVGDVAAVVAVSQNVCRTG